MDVRLNISYKQVYSRATGRRKYACPDPCVIVFFFMLWYVLPPLTILATHVFSHYDQVYRTQKVCISRPMFIRFFFLFWWILSSLKIFDTFLTTLYREFIFMWWRRVIGISGFLIWSKVLMELIFNPCGEFRCEVRRVQLAKSTLLTSKLVPLGSFQIF